MKRLFICLSLLLGFISQLSAQEKWVNYTTSNSGLASNTIKAITEDAKGNFLVGTSNGVSEFDGTNWKSYIRPNFDLDSNARYLIAEGAKGNIWFVTLNGSGVLKFDGTNWTTFDTSNLRLETKNIYKIIEDSKGNIWIGTENNSISKFDGVNWTTYTSNSALVYDWVNSITEDSKGNIWVGTFYNGVSKFDGVNWTIYNTSNTGKEIRTIIEDSKGNIWIGNNGVFKFDGAKWDDYTSVFALHSNSIYIILEDSKGNMWFQSESNVSKFDGVNWTIYNTSNSGLIDRSISAITEDSKGNMWFGTRSGVSKFDGTTWTTYNSTNSGLVSNYINAITEDSNGNMWFSTDSSGVSVLLNSDPKPQKTITGRVYFDKNQNNKLDALENGMANQRIDIKPGNRTAFTNELGEYSFKADSGSTYTFSYMPRDSYKLTKDTSYTFKVSTATTVLDFGIFRKDTIVILSNISLGNGRCNQAKTDYYTFTNAGTVSGDAKVVITLDPDVKVTSSYPMYDSLAKNKVYFTLVNFQAGSTRQIRLSVLNPDFTRMGDTLRYESKLDFKGLVFYSANSQIVRCSYDPNDKAVSPLPVSEKNYSLKNQALTYTIRFQNTGNDTAYYVGVTDTLDANLDWDSFTVLATSHKTHTSMDEKGVVLFAFDNIYLPDSTTNEEKSHGFISYSISPKTGLAENTLVKNTAYIYFDQNPAVVTNTTENNLVSKIPTEGPTGFENELVTLKNNTVIPNPISNTSVLHFENKSAEPAVLYVQDLSGKLVFSKKTSANYFSIDKAEFQNNGMYLYLLQTNTATQSGKIIVE